MAHPERGLYANLHNARERLCLAQMDVDTPAASEALGEAIKIIDRIGSTHCPQWSRFDGDDLL